MERLGTPSLGVMTRDFVSAAELMSSVLGMPGFDFSVIDHPISSADEQGLESRAASTLEAVSRVLLEA